MSDNTPIYYGNNSEHEFYQGESNTGCYLIKQPSEKFWRVVIKGQFLEDDSNKDKPQFMGSSELDGALGIMNKFSGISFAIDTSMKWQLGEFDLEAILVKA